jgi:hypothetical protein
MMLRGASWKANSKKRFLNAVGSGPFSHLLSLDQAIVRDMLGL